MKITFDNETTKEYIFKKINPEKFHKIYKYTKEIIRKDKKKK